MHRISLSVIQIKLYTHQIYDIYDIIIITHFHYCSLLNTLIPRFVLYWGNWIENKRKCGIKKEWKEGKRERRKKRGRGGKEKIKTMENILHRSVYYLLYIYMKRANNASKFSIFNSSLSLSLSRLYNLFPDMAVFDQQPQQRIPSHFSTSPVTFFHLISRIIPI